jgi:hypothetical protein
MKIAWTEHAWQDYLHWQRRDERILACETHRFVADRKMGVSLRSTHLRLLCARGFAHHAHEIADRG